MSAHISDFTVEQWWLASLSDTFLSLHHDDPDVAGAIASEAFGGGYARANFTATAAANRAVWNDNTLSFSSLPAFVATHVALWDAQVNGNLLISAALEEPVAFVAGAGLSFPAHTIAISIG